MTTTVDEIVAADRTRQIEVRKAYHRLCLAIASDERVDPSESNSVISSASKSHEEFASDVEVMRRRLVCRRQLDDRPSVRKQQRIVKERLEALYREWEAAKQQHESELRPLLTERDALLRKGGEIEAAESYLRANVINSSIELDREVVAADIKRLGKARERLCMLLQKNEPKGEVYKLPLREQLLAEAKTELAERAPDVNPEAYAGAEQRVFEATKAVEQSREKIAKLRQELEDVSRDCDAAQSRSSTLRDREVEP